MKVEITPEKLKKLVFTFCLDYSKHCMKYDIVDPTLADVKIFCDSWVDSEVRFEKEKDD
jgi:hypothetical protein